MSRRALTAALIALGLAGPAQAQTMDPEAEHQRGIALRNEHRDAEALEVFRGLYERTGEVRALARMALAEGALSRWAEAEEHLQRALASSDAWVAQNRASLDAALSTVRAHLGSLTVSANVPGAELFVAGHRVATTDAQHPLHLRVPAGTVDLELRSPGYVTARRTVTVRPGIEVTAVDVELASEPSEPSPPRPPVAPPIEALPPEPAAPVIDAQVRRARAERRSTWETLATTGFVLGGAGVLTGAIALGIRESAVGTFNDNGCELVSEGPLVLTSSGRDCSTQYNRAETATAVSITGFVAGAAFTAAGAVAWFVSTRWAPLHALGCAPTPGHRGLVCGGRF